MSAVTMLFCGDALPDLSAGSSDPLAEVRGMIASASLSFVNLEGSVAGDGAPAAPGLPPAPAARKKNVLWATPHGVRYLAEAGFTVANVANNHAFDLGVPGCQAAIRALAGSGVAVVGLRDGPGALPVTVTCGGLRIGLVGYADYGFPAVLMGLRGKTVLADVRRLRNRVDLVVVSLHWGYEYVGAPSPRQRRLARAVVDAGADLVVGQHPHVSQGIERYRRGLVAYSLGNFLFPVDEMPVRLPPEQRDAAYGFALRVLADEGGIRGWETIPVTAFGRPSVQLLAGSALRQSLQRLERLSARLSRPFPGYLSWLWEASRTFALLFRSAWRWRLRTFGPREIVGVARELVNDPILVPMLGISFLRGRR